MEEETVEYFAIGSMMNPMSLNMRGIHPLESRAACLKDYELFFGMDSGFAAARQDPGSEMHGVVHRLTRQELDMLDKIEFWYIKELVEVVPYTGEENLAPVEAFVYIFDPKMVEKYPEKFAKSPPSARYMEILQEGAKHFGLEKTFIENNLENIEIVPRKALTELRTFKIPEGFLPEWTFEKMQEKDKEDKEIVFFAIKKKIFRFNLTGVGENTHFIRKERGTHFAHQIASKYWYEPQYGVPTQVGDMQDELHSYVEDMVIESVLIGEIAKRWTIVATLNN